MASFFWNVLITIIFHHARDLTFFPDATKNSFIPTVNDHVKASVFLEDDEGHCTSGVCCDGATYFLGNIDDTDLDERAIFGGQELVKVRVTVKDITFGEDENTRLSPRATIVDIDVI